MRRRPRRARFGWGGSRSAGSSTPRSRLDTSTRRCHRGWALVRAQPRATPPQPESMRGKGGHTPGSVSSVLCVTAARCWGVARGASKGDMTMPREKDLKRLVRARMQKTGEAYTAARAQVLRKPRAPKRPSDATPAAASARPRPPRSPPKDYAAIAGMSDAIIKEKTGCTWERGCRRSTSSRADEMSHREIAKLVNGEVGHGWWCADGHRRLRAHQGTARARAAARRRLRGEASRARSTCRWRRCSSVGRRGGAEALARRARA